MSLAPTPAMRRMAATWLVLSALATAISGSALPTGAPLVPTPDILTTQVLLDRARFSPGEIDGTPGPNTARAITAFERSTGVTIAEALATNHEPPTVPYVIGTADTAGPFVESIPEDMMAKTALPQLAFTSPLELLAERFHAAPELLRRLNPDAVFAAGQRIVVPNVMVAPSVAPTSPAAAPLPAAVTVTVSRSQSVLTITTATGQTVYHAPATTGSAHDPLPIGQWAVTVVAHHPKFHYNPALFWDADPSHARATVQPGPNGPVGVVWIGLDKPHYGIHGTPEPGAIGHSASHGCVRLTNWDAVAVSGLVARGTRVVFVE